MARRDFDQNPFIAIWEVTRACQLHCVHCRAEAQRHRHPLELTTAEGMRLIDQIAAMDRPLFVLTGGDPLEREDLFTLIDYAAKRGLEVGLTPSATPRLTRDALARAREAGMARCALSLDGATPETHDRFRGTKGSFERTLNGLHLLRELNIPIQINTTATRRNVHELPQLAKLAAEFGATLWSVFFLVPTGRARVQDMLPADEVESVFHWLWETSRELKLPVKTTAAPHYRRILLQRQQGQVQQPGQDRPQPSRSQGRAVNDGNGFVFISHTGDVYPSGFLPVSAGNVRTSSLADLYRFSPLFRSLRDYNLLKGKCRVCEFRSVCGGSRARAYALTGDYLESDPSCSYQPQSFTKAGISSPSRT
ncbi:MAG: TIGR04053 family radical SAM/SPASM domain-containing protein [Alicyclobacillus herbarius]|uniref:TIGR04053 family radical SAM/SPASM domain-containing protein n=1 Tax=Alicyclobacillus herbarius TaxID=122960 RepID=UPI00047B4903|nr:TIGR04053 family radical SAM/SPASM domain-containing protein [Alicyclobacillus herbarius]MCL6631976.1 TIGR04053 family radical SAM/SPASM domain-containing protein [Alicyclobacillus herbarius]